MTVLVLGDVIDDVLVRPLESVTADSDTRAAIRRRPGGSAANQAAWLGYLGGQVSFVGRVGATDVERHRRDLSLYGVDARLVADGGSTGTIVVLLGVADQRTMYTDRGASLRLSRVDVPDELLRNARHLHLTGYSFFEESTRAQTLEILAAARSYGIPFSVDPSSVAFLDEVGADFVGWTSGAVACFPNLDEARCLTGLDSASAAAAALTADYPVVAVTMGSAGVVVAAAGGEPVTLPAPQVECVDPTGAGDAFCAGFLRRWLAGADPVTAAGAGSAAAAQAIGQLGARPPTATPTPTPH
ncbi:MAG TPA: PfkB family carbohydrate kinase [Mycobacteriales bacterium]|nr:PfkB family carbohydrate kinase [Mycobacteriales bacterium]